MISPADHSYRALLRVPSLPRIVAAMVVSRVGGSMTSVAIVLFTLAEYDSPELAGIVTFAAIMPGILVSPIAGALLDRHGRIRLVMLDYLVAAMSLVLIGGLGLVHGLPAWALVVIAALSSLTMPLSATGVRSLFPLIVPEPLWERVNALDSNGWVVATLIGPPLAAAMVQVLGGPITIIAIGLMMAVAALIIAGAHEPPTIVVSTGRLLRDSLDGLMYVLHHRSLRGLALCISSLNLSGGVLTIAIPVIVVDQLHASEALVGIAWAMSGVTGMISATWFGRRDSRGREKSWLVWGTLGIAGAFVLLLVSTELGVLLLSMAINGALNGPLDIAMFTLRQRRTDQAWMGRAFAVSAALNFAGYPIGSAIAGVLIAQSVQGTIAFGLVACLVASVLAATQIPRVDERAVEEALAA